MKRAEARLSNLDPRLRGDDVDEAGDAEVVKRHNAMKNNVPSRLFLALALSGLSAGARPADAVVVTPRGPAAIISPIVVDTYADDFANNGLCSLREAVESVRQHASVGGCDFPLLGTPSIELSTGTYILTRTGTITGGSLNLNGTVVINGVGMTQTVIKQTVGGERVITVDAGRATLRDLAITGGSGSEGGGLFNNATATLDGVRVFSNTASGGGGVENGPLMTMTIQNSLIDRNSASSGAGVRNTGTLVMRSSAIVSNTANSSAGGLKGDGPTTLENVTIMGNTAGSLGGGIAQAPVHALHARSTTIARNVSGNVGGGLHLQSHSGGAVTFENSIVAENRQTGVGDSDCAGAPADALYSLVADGGCSVGALFESIAGTSAATVTVKFGPVTFADGVIPHLTLLANSPAVNRGDVLACAGTADTPPATDALGAPRVQGGRCDMGAVEFSGVANPPPTPTPTATPTPLASTALPVNTFTDDFAPNGLCSLREAAESVRVGTGIGGCALGAGPRHVIQLAGGTYALTRTGQITGGGLNLTGTVDIVGAGAGQTIIQQSAPSSRVIEVDGGAILLQDLTVTGGANAVGLGGGGIRNVGNLVLRRAEVRGNATNVEGGGISNNGELVLEKTVVRENQAGTGGGIWSGSAFEARDSAIFWNRADQSGGIDAAARTDLINTSVISNFGSGVGGIRLNGAGRLTLANATVAQNLAGSGGAGLSLASTSVVTMFNSVVGANRLSNGLTFDCDADGTSLNIMFFSFLGQPASAFCLPAHAFFNQIGAVTAPITPAFASINTGPNPHLPLAFSSASINAGDPNGCRTLAWAPLTADQIGTGRPQGGRCDMGAVEFNGPPPRQIFLPSVRR